MMTSWKELVKDVGAFAVVGSLPLQLPEKAIRYAWCRGFAVRRRTGSSPLEWAVWGRPVGLRSGNSEMLKIDNNRNIAAGIVADRSDYCLLTGWMS